MMRFRFAILALTVLPAVAASEDMMRQEKLLRAAMSLSGDGESRSLDSGEAIRAYMNSGHVRKRPEARADYVDYRLVRKPATLFGHRLLVLEEEYMDTYIGCCVSPGIGAVVEMQGDRTALDAFAAANKCRINAISSPEDALDAVKLAKTPGASYLSVSCRVRDQQAE